MAAFTLNPDGVGTYSDWTNVGGATALISCSDASDATYIQNPADATGRRHSFTMEGLPVYAMTIVGDVSHNARIGRTGAAPGTGQAHFRYSGTTSELPGGGWTFGTTWTDQVTAYALAPGAVAWTPAIVNATEIGIYSWGSAVDVPLCAKLYATGTFSLPGGGLVFLLASHVGWAIGANLLLEHMPRVALEVWRHKLPGLGRFMLEPDEWEPAWRAWRAHPFRVYG